MKAGFPGVEFLRSTPKFKNRKKILSSSVFTSSVIRHTGKFHVVVVQCRRRNVKNLGAFVLDLFPKAPLGEMVGFGFALGFDFFHVCGYTVINCPQGRKNVNPISR